MFEPLNPQNPAIAEPNNALLKGICPGTQNASLDETVICERALQTLRTVGETYQSIRVAKEVQQPIDDAHDALQHILSEPQSEQETQDARDNVAAHLKKLHSEDTFAGDTTYPSDAIKMELAANYDAKLEREEREIHQKILQLREAINKAHTLDLALSKELQQAKDDDLRRIYFRDVKLQQLIREIAQDFDARLSGATGVNPFTDLINADFLTTPEKIQHLQNGLSRLHSQSTHEMQLLTAKYSEIIHQQLTLVYAFHPRPDAESMVKNQQTR